MALYNAQTYTGYILWLYTLYVELFDLLIAKFQQTYVLTYLLT